MVDLAHARVVAILTRAPSSGGKSRLFRELQRPPDRNLLEALLLDTIEAVRAAGARIVVAVTPPSACDEVEALVAPLRASGTVSIEVAAQPDGDLGGRMYGTMHALFARGAAIVTVIGSDVPEIDAGLVTAACDALMSEPEAVVLGPSDDGGYYLVGATQPPHIFDGIEWGTVRVFEQTQRAAARSGMRVHVLPARGDVDTAADLRRVAAVGSARRTAEWARRNGVA
jgi:uncharacterized protein